MEKSRAIFFEYNDEEIHFDLGTFALCMYYAVTLNSTKAKKLFDATLTEWAYRFNYELSEGNLTSNDLEAHFVTSDILEAITFIENDLIPALNNEKQDLLKQYKGISNFINLYDSTTPFLRFFGVFENDFSHSDGESLAHYMNLLKTALQHSLSVNQPLIIYVL
ncbi:hypothetical protein [Flavobacterium gelatinilyticum]|uniref:hypothetical protein n=1 Tax=Flavobacterium gelatinilyticum TaxID=3003260 RepID=UPI002480AC77|nr:hypothetical protein [Flavobacterium gelatinilyticum]